MAKILKLKLGTVFPQVIGAAQAEDKLNHVGALLRGKFDFKSDSQGESCWKRDGNIKDFFSEELQKANQELEPEGVHLFPVSVLDRDQLVLYRLKNPF